MSMAMRWPPKEGQDDNVNEIDPARDRQLGEEERGSGFVGASWGEVDSADGSFAYADSRSWRPGVLVACSCRVGGSIKTGRARRIYPVIRLHSLVSLVRNSSEVASFSFSLRMAVRCASAYVSGI